MQLVEQKPTKWRDDLKSDEVRTYGHLVVCAEDNLGGENVFDLVLVHGENAHGKGFMPSVRVNGSVRHNGTFVLGVDEKAYLAARAEGMSVMRRLAKARTGV